MAIGDIWEANVQGIINTKLMENVFHFKMLSSADPASTIGAFLVTSWIDSVEAYQSNNFTWNQIALYNLTVPPTGSEYATGLPSTGVVNSPMSDLRSSCVFSWRTALLGRSYRGRTYLPGVPQELINEGQFTTGTVTALQAIGDAIVSDVGEGGSNPDIQLGVWSLFLGAIPVRSGKPPYPKPTGYNLVKGWTPINRCIVDQTVFTQRRRGYGVRIHD